MTRKKARIYVTCIFILCFLWNICLRAQSPVYDQIDKIGKSIDSTLYHGDPSLLSMLFDEDRFYSEILGGVNAEDSIAFVNEQFASDGVGRQLGKQVIKDLKKGAILTYLNYQNRDDRKRVKLLFRYVYNGQLDYHQYILVPTSNNKYIIEDVFFARSHLFYSDLYKQRFHEYGNSMSKDNPLTNRQYANLKDQAEDGNVGIAVCLSALDSSLISKKSDRIIDKANKLYSVTRDEFLKLHQGDVGVTLDSVKTAQKKIKNRISNVDYPQFSTWQQSQNEKFRNAEKSPLSPNDLGDFQYLDFFPYDINFRIEARLERTPDGLVFEMPTTSRRRPVYKEFGFVHFNIEGQHHRLKVFQSLALSDSEAFRKHLFLPFYDATSGSSTYGGGRYIDLTIPEGDVIIIDFNEAFNPYCAYSNSWSCPITPLENNLQSVSINAGTKAYRDEGH